MRIKSLLLGSAAALVAVSGARAADAIIAEPEPVEYVRVCDVYGTGFFYIPGTETCLKIGGFVRYEMYWSDTADGWDKNSQVAVSFDARSDTEWGLLRGLIILESGEAFGINANGRNTTNDFILPVDHAIIQLGGLFMGYNDSLWASSSVQLGSPLGNYGTHSMSGLRYGFQQRQQFGYQFTGGNGFYGAVALEHDPEADGVPDDDYMPDVVGKLAWATGWGGIYGTIGYDEDSSGFGVRAGVQFDMPNSPGSNLRLFGIWTSDDGVDYGTGVGLDQHWAVVASYFHRFNPAWGASVGFEHISFEDLGSENIVEAYAIWTPVGPGFSIQAEVSHAFDADETVGRLRFERSF